MVGLVQTLWSGLETKGMKDAKCSLLLQEDAAFEPKIKSLPKQRVLVYQDKGFKESGNPDGAAGNDAAAGDDGANGDATSGIGASSQHSQASSLKNGESTNSNDGEDDAADNFCVDFKGCTILQLEPSFGPTPQRTMPVTLTVGGRCIFTPENYHDFRVMMRTKEQSKEMDIAPNGNFDWPDVSSMLLCPLCGTRAQKPDERDDYDEEYWMLFYPLLQITVMRGSQMTLGTRTVCRLTCLECMENLLEGMTLTVQPGATEKKRTRLCFTLPASGVLAEAGSASFLEDGPPRPDTHPHVDDVLDAWTLYNLWEHSGAWEALQNDYRIVLSRSMHGGDPDPKDDESKNDASSSVADTSTAGGTTRGGMSTASSMTGATRDTSQSSRSTSGAPKSAMKEKLGRNCGAHPKCKKVHGQRNPNTGDILRLNVKCKECHQEYYCSKYCREKSKEAHKEQCDKNKAQREERRNKKSKRVQCDTCHKKLPYTQMKKCSRCRKATYCSVECQRKAWATHKSHCVKRTSSSGSSS